MIAIFRAFLNTWAAKLFFVVLIGVFVIWGVGDIFRNRPSDRAIATVGERRIEAEEVAEAYRRQLSQMMRMLGAETEPSVQMRKGVAAQALEQLITQAALREATGGLGIVVSDAALRQAVWATPAFAGPDRNFDRAQFLAVLRNAGLSEARYLDLVRQELGQRQLMAAARAGAVAPAGLARLVYAFQQEKRVADMVVLRFADAPRPGEPDGETLQRWYANHQDRFSTPELRRIKLALLAPETLADETRPDEAELRAAYERRRADFDRPERRSVQVLLSQDEDKARALAERWAGGADWTALQDAAREAGAAPVELNEATQGEIPAAELAAAVFAAEPGRVVGPVRSALGWHVLRVGTVTPGLAASFEAVRPLLEAQIRADRAADLIYERANKVDDLLAGGTALDEMPGDLGLAGLTGTLDARGTTAEGTPAPIPGSEALRAHILQTAFRTPVGEPARLIEGPRQPGTVSAFYALVVEEITPPAPRPFAEVAAQVRADWEEDAVRRHHEQAAAALLAAVKGGQSFADAALLADLPVTRLPPVSRGAAPGEQVPVQLIDPLFTIGVGEATMAETADGFVVAALAELVPADPDADPIGYGQVRDSLVRAIADDMQASLVTGLRDRLKPQVNRDLLERIAQPE